MDDLELAGDIGRDAEGHADPARGALVFEVTETAAIVNIERPRAVSREQLRELGCLFALDDFGSGFGSFYYLKHLHFDFLKIDGEFIVNCVADATDQLLIGAVVDIARGLGTQTVAEFVGDDATVELLGSSAWTTDRATTSAVRPRWRAGSDAPRARRSPHKIGPPGGTGRSGRE